MKITGAANLTFAFSWHLNKVLNFPLSSLCPYLLGAPIADTASKVILFLSFMKMMCLRAEEIFSSSATKGTFFNYVDQFLTYFDPLPPYS